MGRRDVVIVAAVALIAGFAAADALRSGASDERPPPETAPPPRDETTPPAERELDATGFATGALRGSLVFTDGDDCRVREIGLAGATERPLPDLVGDCNLWAPPDGPHIAYGLGSGRPGRVPFSFFDLNNPNRALRAFAARSHFIAWSLDGQRAAWCDERGRGVEYEIRSDRMRRLPACPAAYTSDGDVAFVQGSRLVVAGRTLIQTSGQITFVRWGTDGSVAIVVDRRRLERWSGGKRTYAADLRSVIVRGRDSVGGPPVLSPDNCAALFPISGGGLQLLRLPCFAAKTDPNPDIFVAVGAAWSPDGDWIALTQGGGSVEVLFVRVVGAPRTTRLRVPAVQLAWRD